METNDDTGTECKSDLNEEDIEMEGTCSEESLSVNGTGKLSDVEEGGAFEGEAVFRDSLSSDGTIVCSPDGDETAPLNKSIITLHTNSSQSTSASMSDPMTPVLDDIIHPIDGKEEDSLLTTIMNSVEGGTTFEASLETMEAMGHYWHPQVSPTAVTSTGRFFFTSPSRKTVVYVRFRDIGAKVAIRVTVHSLPDRRRLATREWLSVAVAYSDRGFDNGWVTMDMDTGVLTIFNAVGVSGEWKLDEVAEVAKYQDRFFDESEIYRSMSLSRSFQPSTSEEAAELDAKLRSQLSDRARTKVYPVITNDDGWILNHKNEHLLWLPVKSQAERRFRTKWRWAQQRLILSGNVIGSRGLMVIDFNGVDMEAPNALQAVEKLTWGTPIHDPTRNFSEEIGWKRLIISGLNVLE
ncbi:hypothetical protein H0H93_003282 [Arthromyces matolae]|nr:hypothetical protein H0H93_003282 [Arthromyces matolae]